jgi:pimeloyl-ACP methyl ester carboxylesterase
MSHHNGDPRRATVRTPSGTIAYAEQGSGPVALFVHGVLLNSYLWRHQLSGLSDIRRCIAPDLLAHGDTEIAPGQDLSVTANAEMFAQIFAARHPERIRTLTLTDCDTHDNWPPEAFKPFLAMAAAGGLRDALTAMVGDKNVYRSPGALGPAYERPEQVSDETIDTYLGPHLRTPERTRDLERFLAAFDPAHTVAVEPRLRTLAAPTFIGWGTDDIYFGLEWGDWLARTIPGTRRHIRFDGARVFFPEERWREFNRELRSHWGEV